ncbi:Cationic amino acid transporter 1 [Senna tora]|uniref:Cationic amino acid transporter 1 n=1 Tax=Senna tora TaxID=362788 RepID=A0A834T4H4_9FABA|nr:Cationic amino acid transporter 1 [Senna tora]
MAPEARPNASAASPVGPTVRASPFPIAKTAQPPRTRPTRRHRWPSSRIWQRRSPGLSLNLGFFGKFPFSPSRLPLPRTAHVSFASPSLTRRCVSVAGCCLSVAVSVGSPTHERTLSRLSVAVAISVGSPTHERTSLLAIVLPFLFQRFTILVLESASFCSSIGVLKCCLKNKL